MRMANLSLISKLLLRKIFNRNFEISKTKNKTKRRLKQKGEKCLDANSNVPTGSSKIRVNDKCINVKTSKQIKIRAN